ncbi:hypothetical protein MAA8898_04227 [Maliponia aquimaris]|uniref:Uncharacterized protein n=1 Tax=Maliponia aquimaris TaxID=1673631 RepID=A0A238L337_9RHOB|nr:hypothetical protein MAA8898_04227 [Maliponia aquimaris]
MLAAVLAVTGLSVAQARGQAGPAGALVICQGLTVVTILVDAEGQPVEQAHVCPDAALALFVHVGDAAPLVSRAVAWDAIAWPGADSVGVAQWGQAARARGPPVVL